MSEVELVVSTRTILMGKGAEQDFVSLLKGAIEGVEIYEQQFVPGVIYASAKQWKLVGNINTIFGVLSSALAFYLAFKPDETKENASGPVPQIIVKIENAGHNNVFRIGADIKNEEDLIRQLRDSVTLLKTQLELEQTKATVDQLRNSPHWKRTY